MAWRYATIPAKARYEPLGPAGLGQLKANTHSLFEALRRGHDDVGNHNALEVARMVGALTYSAGWTATSFQSSRLTLAGGHAPATGQLIGTIGSAWAQANLSTALLNARDSDVANVPHMLAYRRLSATTLGVYQQKLTDTLTTGFPSAIVSGSGNTWAAVDNDFDLALFAPRYVPTATLPVLYAPEYQVGWAFGEEATQHNALVEQQAILQAAVDAEHTAAGLHDTPLVARAFSPVTWGGASYSVSTSLGVASVSRTSQGIVVVTLSDTFTGTGNMHAFARSNDTGALQLVHCRPTSTTQVTCYLYQYLDSTVTSAPDTWCRNDFDFSLWVFGNL